MTDLKTINIKGKEYVTVDERLKDFRAKHPNYSLTTNIVELTEDRVVMQATICDENGHILASGTAYEKADSSFINKTSYIENCETSAWGRALGNLGIGLIGSVASADEVINAVNNQTETEKAFNNVSSLVTCDSCKGNNTKHLKGTSKSTGKPYDFYKCNDCGFTFDA